MFRAHTLEIEHQFGASHKNINICVAIVFFFIQFLTMPQIFFGVLFYIPFCLLLVMVNAHFFIHDDRFKIPYQKIDYSAVSMVYYDGNYCHICLANKDSIKIKISLSDCYIKYFKPQEEFIRSAENYIININHIIGASKRDKAFLNIFLTGDNQALLRMSHIYAQRILSGDKKSNVLFNIPRMVDDSVRKDELIIEYSASPLLARKKIREELNEKVTIPYIRRRLRQILNHG